MDIAMPSASSGPKFYTNFGVTSMNNLISQMPDHPVLNIGCQSREEIKAALNLLQNWTIVQRTRDATLTGLYLANHIVSGLSGLAAEWWKHLAQEAKDNMLRARDADQEILKALTREFYGDDLDIEPEHYASLFMTARLCNLSQHQQYFCYMQKLLIYAGKANDSAYLKHYLRSFPGHVPDAVEKFMKDRKITYQGLSIAQLHAYIMETWQEHCLEKRVEKDFKRHQDMFTPSFCKNVAQMPDWGCGSHNRGHLQSSCKCNHKKKKGFYSSEPRYHHKDKPL